MIVVMATMIADGGCITTQMTPKGKEDNAITVFQLEVAGGDSGWTKQGIAKL